MTEYNNLLMKSLSNDLIILAKIYEYEKVKKEPLWFTKLANLLDGKLDITSSKTTKLAVSQSEDKMYDLGMIDKRWEKADGRWTYCYHLEDEVESFAKTIYERIKR